MNYTIAHAEPGDAEGLVRFVKALGDEGLSTLMRITTIPSLEEELEFIERIGKEESSAFWVVRDAGGEVVGSLNLFGQTHPQRRHSAGFGLSLLAAHRGKGLGTRLINEMLDWAGKAGLARVELEVLSNNSGAVKLYRRMGFVEEGRKVGAVRLDAGEVDLIQMAKKI
jgi:RimJ/RimL family protein N-acetyltransferase